MEEVHPWEDGDGEEAEDESRRQRGSGRDREEEVIPDPKLANEARRIPRVDIASRSPVHG